MSADTSAPRLKMPWWTSPVGLTLGFLLPVIVFISFIGETNHPGLTIRGTRFLGIGYVAMGVAMLLSMALAAWIALRVTSTQPAFVDRSRWNLAATTLGVIGFVAMTIWFKDFLTNPGLLWQVLSGRFKPEREDIELTTGITSLANFVPIFFAIYAFQMREAGARLPWYMHLLCSVLVAFTLFRVYVWSERLALIEAIIPFGLVLGARAWSSRNRVLKFMAFLGPFVALPALVLYFGIAEYSRSWASGVYSQLDFWDFAVGRFASYYYTALNNGAGLLATTEWPNYKFDSIFSWLHRAPLSVGQVFGSLTNVAIPNVDHDIFLARFADVEFNSPSALYSVVGDIGLPLAFVYFSLCAALAGFLFVRYQQGRLPGVALYPMFFISYLEIFRYPYLGQSRAFTPMVGFILVLLIVHADRLLGRPARSTEPGEPVIDDSARASFSPEFSSATGQMRK
jgi:hypothetical protein